MDAKERAEQRRRTWQGGVARSFAEAEEMDLAFWMSATPAERLRGATELALALLTEDNDGAPPRLQRAVGGVRPLKG